MRCSSRLFASCIGFLIYSGYGAAGQPQTVSYPSTDPANEMRFGRNLSIPAKLYKPSGRGPFPAAIMLHGCSGPSEQRNSQYSSLFLGWGYVAIFPDSLAPRGIDQVCPVTHAGAVRKENDPKIVEYRRRSAIVNPIIRKHDVLDTVNYLITLPYVDSRRIVVIGFSHGGETAMQAASAQALKDAKALPRAFVAFYPGCYNVFTSDFSAPLLVLAGDKDEAVLLSSCKQIVKNSQDKNYPAEIVVYPETYHGFDAVGANAKRSFGTVRYQESAHKDSIGRIKIFLQKSNQ